MRSGGEETEGGEVGDVTGGKLVGMQQDGRRVEERG